MPNPETVAHVNRLSWPGEESTNEILGAEVPRRFLPDKGNEKPTAFELLVRKHGPMVWATCWRLLGNHPAVEIAFQATLLTLSQRDQLTTPRAAVGIKLHRLALQAAMKLLASRRSDSATNLLPVCTDKSARTKALDRAIDRLPFRDRGAFILCDLEGLSKAQAAKELGCTIEILDARLSAALNRLQTCLMRQGIESKGLDYLSLGGSIPPTLLASTITLGNSISKASADVVKLVTQLKQIRIRGRSAIVGAATALILAAFVVLSADSETLPPTVKPEIRFSKAGFSLPQRPVAQQGPRLLLVDSIVNPVEGCSRIHRLFRVDFVNGKPMLRKELYSGEASVLGESGQRIILDRFVVLPSATVVDLVQKKTLNAVAGGRVLAIEGSKIYFTQSGISGENAVFCFDLTLRATEQVATMGDGRWILQGALSPDGMQAIARLWTGETHRLEDERPYELVWDRVDQPRTPLGDGFASTLGIRTNGSFPPEPPGVWLDNERFVTQTTRGKLVILNPSKGTRERLADIEGTLKPGEKAWNTSGAKGFTPLGFQQPRFSRLPDGRVLYEADAIYLIDVEKKTWEKAAWRPLGFGFEYSAKPDKIVDVNPHSKKVIASIRYNGKIIGTSESIWWTTPEKPRVVVADGYIALLEHIARPGKIGRANSIRVWSATTGSWIVLDGCAESLIGW